jgi:aerobic-type carbon monoxide dehydrogenase small subunit (CoxS/CutS family)
VASQSLTVNGKAVRVEAAADETLLSVLRDDLRLTGTKYGCGEGQCGACTVLIDGKATPSCQTAVSDAAGRKVTTVEGLAAGERLHPVQAAFLEVEAFQCGFCTPGMVVAAASLLRSNPSPSDAEIVEAMTRNICRCGTYPRIVAAVKLAARRNGSR